MWKFTFNIAEMEHSFLTHLEKGNCFKSLNLYGIYCQRSMAINENICSPGSIYFYSEFVKILIGRISGVIVLYVAGIMENMVKE